MAPLRYLSHFITPPGGPIRFTARFFLAPVPPGQSPRLFTEETSEGLWIEPAAGVARYEADQMPMAEPGESGLRYLAGFPSLEALWQFHADGRHKFHGIGDRLVDKGVRVRRPRGAPADRRVTPAAVPNATVAFLDAAVEEGQGARRALVTPAGAASYAELLALVERAGAGLRARGVAAGRSGGPSAPRWPRLGRRLLRRPPRSARWRSR